MKVKEIKFFFEKFKLLDAFPLVEVDIKEINKNILIQFQELLKTIALSLNFEYDDENHKLNKFKKK